MSGPGLPHHAAAERSVLGAILLAQDSLDLVLPILTPDDFFVPAHRAIFEAMLAIRERSASIDLVSMEAELVRLDSLRLVGGVERLGAMTDSYATVHNVEQHAERVRDLGIQRRLILATREIQARAAEPADNVEDLVAWAEHQLYTATDSADTSGLCHVFDGLEGVVKGFIAAQKSDGETLNGALTGLADLDRVTRGFHPGEVTILAARPSMGKTSLAMNLAISAGLPRIADLMANRVPTTTPIPVLIFSLEMGKEELQSRICAAHSRLNYTRMREGKLSGEDFRRLSYTVDALQKSGIYIDDTVTLSMASIRAAARQWRRRARLDQIDARSRGLIVIDYLQLVKPSGKYGSREQEVSEVSRGLKILARETKCPVICLSQLNRNLENRDDKRPRMADLRESGAIEQDADKIMFIYRPEQYARDEEERDKLAGQAEIIVAKNRNGPTATVHATWLAPQMRFVDRQEEPYG